MLLACGKRSASVIGMEIEGVMAASGTAAVPAVVVVVVYVYLYWQETKVGLAGKAGENVKLVAAQEILEPGEKFLIADV
jgi:hypothetical protein